MLAMKRCASMPEKRSRTTAWPILDDRDPHRKVGGDGGKGWQERVDGESADHG
jgi:hypothetical protein